MPTEIEKIASKIAHSPLFDGYSLWRVLKDVNNQIFDLQRKRAPIPIELVRLRVIIAKSQQLRRARTSFRPATRRAPQIRVHAPEGFDPHDFVDHYRSLGGRRLAVDMGRAKIEIRHWNEDTQEAADFWARRWGILAAREQSAVAQALLLRGRY